MKRLRERTKSRCYLNYSALESRELLAAVINGTGGDDVLNVSYVDDQTILYILNDEASQKLDVSEGLNIKLQDGNDKVSIGANIVADVQLIFVEDISVDAKANDWRIGFVADPGQLGRFTSAGMVNDNITFLGATTLNGSSGLDSFTVNSKNSSGLRMHGGGLDDLFRFSADSYDSIEASGVKALGESGDDQFIFFGAANATVDGGIGYDVVDFRQSDQQLSLRSGQLMQDNEKIIAPLGLNSNVKAPSGPIGDFSYAWVIDGNQTVLTNESSGWSVELENFQKLEGSSHGFDRFWVLATTEDIELWDADWIQISSDMDASQGNLDAIDHDVSIVRSGGYYEVIGDTVEFIEDEDGVLSPRVVISDITSEAANVGVFDAVNVISGLANGDIKFIDLSQDVSSQPEAGVPGPDTQPGVPDGSDFKPEIVVHGSETAGDQFVVETVWTKTSIYGHGGDDDFMVGSSIENGNGDLRTIAGTLEVFGGEGFDRMIANNHLGQHNAYRLEPGKLREAPMLETSRPLMQVLFNASLEVARLNGSGSQATNFDVFPSQYTKFVVDGTLQQAGSDRLQLIGSVEGQLFNFDGTGSWQLADGYKPVHFYGIEDMPEIAPKMLDGFFGSKT